MQNGVGGGRYEEQETFTEGESGVSRQLSPEAREGEGILQMGSARKGSMSYRPAVLGGMHSGTSAAPTKGKAPLVAIQRVKHVQGYSGGTDKGDSQLYSPVVIWLKQLPPFLWVIRRVSELPAVSNRKSD